MALSYAKKGFGRTFPNPSVGCVLVAQQPVQQPPMQEQEQQLPPQNNNDVVIGAGFHPQAGFPHAEVFALLEAFGHVESGVEAAESVVCMAQLSSSSNQQPKQRDRFTTLYPHVQQLALQYASPDGPAQLFGPALTDENLSKLPPWRQQVHDNKLTVTAYVTLEPCCHFGRTPPCAMALITTSAIHRVVVGLRDPNPKVQGGGIQLLRDAGIVVDVVPHDSHLYSQCHDMVAGFLTRITRTPMLPNVPLKGAQRASLRSMANTKKVNGSLSQLTWPGPRVVIDEAEDMEVDEDGETDEEVAFPSSSAADEKASGWQMAVDTVHLDPAWLETIDAQLWNEELILLRLKSAVAKRKWAERLGQRVAQAVQAQVIQSVGHTVLLYRPKPNIKV